MKEPEPTPVEVSDRVAEARERLRRELQGLRSGVASEVGRAPRPSWTLPLAAAAAGFAAALGFKRLLGRGSTRR